MGKTLLEEEREAAEYYDRTRDLSEFDGGTVELIAARRDVTISVRFSEEEIEAVRAAAEQAGVKVTAYIRAAALDGSGARRQSAVAGLIERLAGDVEQLRKMTG
jgi:predicted DNA binding CopG/RHH family protein